MIDIGAEFTVASFLYMGAERFGRLRTLSKARLEGANIKKLLYELFGVPVREVTQAIRIETLPLQV